MADAARDPRVLVIGNPENRRNALFVEAVERGGYAPPVVIAWADVLADPEVLLDVPDTPHLVRVDSTGENAEVATRLLERGRARAREFGCEQVDARTAAERRFGQVVGPRQTHLGFLDALEGLEAVFAQRPSWRVAQPLDTIRTCFDKNATADALQAAGVPVARAVRCATPDDVLRAHADIGRSLWVKVTCASSASCLAVVRGGARPHLMTTLRQLPHGRFNSLRVCRVQGDGVRPTLQWLLDEGARVEVDLPKARLEGAFFDLRVLVIRGEPRFLVVRQSRHGITNLHLGGWRGDPEALFARLGESGKARLVEVCRGVGRALPHWYLGVDVLVGPEFRTLHVLEVNAFGDLLPRLENAGLDTYGAEMAAILPRTHSPVLQSL